MLYFIVNEKSRTGKGALIWAELEAVLEEKKVEYTVWKTQYERHAMSLAKRISNMEDDEITLIVVGGDGTVNEVLNGIEHFEKIRFGTVPTGSGNDLARGLGISRTPVEQLQHLLVSEEEFVMDLGEVAWNGCTKPHVFAISAGIGVDAEVCKRALTSKLKKALNKIHLGKLTYIILTIHSLFTMVTANADVKIENKRLPNMKRLYFAAAMNFRAEGGGVPMAPRADAQDGKLSVCCVHDMSKPRAFSRLPFLVAAKHEKIKGFDIMDVKECDIHVSSPMVLHTDGEYCGDVTDVHFECLPARLRVIK